MSNKGFSGAVGSALGTYFANTLRARLLGNSDFIASVKRMHHSNLKLSISTFKSSMELADSYDIHLYPYHRDLVFEGHRITAAARNALFDHCSNAASYDDINGFNKRLVWWIIDSNPYVNPVDSPAAPDDTTSPQKSMTMKWGYAISAGIIILFATQVGLWILPVMAAVLVITQFATKRQTQPDNIEPEWLWLEQYQ
jgi:hypothetical protein